MLTWVDFHLIEQPLSRDCCSRLVSILRRDQEEGQRLSRPIVECQRDRLPSPAVHLSQQGFGGSRTRCNKNTFPLQSVQNLWHVLVETNLIAVSRPLLRLRRLAGMIWALTYPVLSWSYHHLSSAALVVGQMVSPTRTTACLPETWVSIQRSQRV